MDENFKEIAVEIGKEVVKEAYQDLAKPVASGTGNLLGLIPRYISAKLEPLQMWIMEREYHIEATNKMLAIKLEGINPEKIVTPEAYIAVPALQAISYCIDCDEIREMYVNLLATSMNADQKNNAHPAFVEVIKQFTPDEAKLIKYFSSTMPALIDFEFIFDIGVVYKGNNYTNIKPHIDIEENEEAYISNLLRLGIIEKVITDKNTCSSEFKKVEEIIFKKCKENMAEETEHNFSDIELSYAFKPQYYWIELTSFGEKFCDVCLGSNKSEDE